MPATTIPESPPPPLDDHRCRPAPVSAARPALAVSAANSPTDWDDVGRLLHEYVDWIRSAAGFDPLVVQPRFAAELEALPDHFSGERATMLLARRAGRPVGTVGVRFHVDVASGPAAELTRLYVPAEARGQGVADALVEAALVASARRGAVVARLESVRGPMDAAIAVYHRHGFQPTTETGSLPLDGLVAMTRRL